MSDSSPPSRANKRPAPTNTSARTTYHPSFMAYACTGQPGRCGTGTIVRCALARSRPSLGHLTGHPAGGMAEYDYRPSTLQVTVVRMADSTARSGPTEPPDLLRAAARLARRYGVTVELIIPRQPGIIAEIREADLDTDLVAPTQITAESVSIQMRPG